MCTTCFCRSKTTLTMSTNCRARTTRLRRTQSCLSRTVRLRWHAKLFASGHRRTSLDARVKILPDYRPTSSVRSTPKKTIMLKRRRRISTSAMQAHSIIAQKVPRSTAHRNLMSKTSAKMSSLIRCWAAHSTQSREISKLSSIRSGSKRL